MQQLKMLGLPTADLVIASKGRHIGVLGKPCFNMVQPLGSNFSGTAVVASLGELRLLNLSGSEPVIAHQLALPHPNCQFYGVPGNDALTRQIFGLLPAELRYLVNLCQQGGLPQIVFCEGPAHCCVSRTIIPPFWPCIQISKSGHKVVTQDVFIRIMLATPTKKAIAIAKYPGLWERLIQMANTTQLGVPYLRELLSQINP